MQIYDITRPMEVGMMHWPGDAPFEHEWSARIGVESVANVSTIRMCTHSGTHADAPLHYMADGPAITDVPLDRFIGPAYVVDVGDHPFVGVQAVAHVDFEQYRRILIRTRSSRADGRRWDPSFPYLDPEFCQFLVNQRIVLVGTDSPSVDPASSSDLPAHHILGGGGIVILENLALGEVSSGPYELIALPLKLSGLDGAPVRAVLRENCPSCRVGNK